MQQWAWNTSIIDATALARPLARAPAAKGSADTDGPWALAVLLKAKLHREGFHAAEPCSGTPRHRLTQCPHQVWAAAALPAACTPEESAALPSAGL